MAQAASRKIGAPFSNLINPKYKFPEYFYWPFFFTLQTNGEVRRKQIHMWIDLVLKYCQDNKVWKLTPEIFSTNLGQNPKIKHPTKNQFLL